MEDGCQGWKKSGRRSGRSRGQEEDAGRSVGYQSSLIFTRDKHHRGSLKLVNEILEGISRL
jgi:hypothetical protein